MDEIIAHAVSAESAAASVVTTAGTRESAVSAGQVKAQAITSEDIACWIGRAG